MNIRGTIEQYAFLPEHGGGACCTGVMDGVPWQTTTIVKVNTADRQIQTKTGSIYQLGAARPGLWGLQLQILRLESYEKLEALV